MKIERAHIAVLLLAVLFAACEKKELELDPDRPSTLFVEAKFDQEAKSWTTDGNQNLAQTTYNSGFSPSAEFSFFDNPNLLPQFSIILTRLDSVNYNPPTLLSEMVRVGDIDYFGTVNSQFLEQTGVTIFYSDDARLFYSDNPLGEGQPGLFKISAVRERQVEGQTYYEADVEFACTLYQYNQPGAMDSILVTDGRGTVTFGW